MFRTAIVDFLLLSHFWIAAFADLSPTSSSRSLASSHTSTTIPFKLSLTTLSKAYIPTPTKTSSGTPPDPWWLKLADNEQIKFTAYGRPIDSEAIFKMIAVGKAEVKEEDRNDRTGMMAMTWAYKAKGYAILFKLWPNQITTWGDVDNILNGLVEFWHLWGMSETNYELFKEISGEKLGLGTGFVHILVDPTSKALHPVPTVSTPASTVPELESIGAS